MPTSLQPQGKSFLCKPFGKFVGKDCELKLSSNGEGEEGLGVL